MDKNEILGNTAMYGGSIVTSCAAPAAYISESTMLIALSAIGAIATVSGLVYTIWNGNRNFNLARAQFEAARKKEHAREDSQRHANHLTVVESEPA